MIKKILFVTYRIWLISCVVFLLMGFVCNFINPPEQLPLPWSDIADFTEDADGRVYVLSNFYLRVLCYDNNGEFLKSYPAPADGSTQLASDVHGRLYFKAAHKLYTYNSSWDLLQESVAEKDDYIHRSWVLVDSKVESVKTIKGQNSARVDKLADSGDCLFSGPSSPRKYFYSPDGSKLIMSRYSIKRYSPDGELMTTYDALLATIPFTFPIPALFLIVILIAELVIREVNRKRAKRTKATHKSNTDTSQDNSNDPAQVQSDAS